MPSDKLLFFFVPSEVRSDEIYNPTNLVTYRANLDSDIAAILNVQGPSVVLVKKLGSQEYEIVRRIPWPASQSQFNALMATYAADGEGNHGGVFSTTDEELPPIPAAIRNFFQGLKNIGVAVIVAAIAITIVQDEKE